MGSFMFGRTSQIRAGYLYHVNVLATHQDMFGLTRDCQLSLENPLINRSRGQLYWLCRY